MTKNTQEKLHAILKAQEFVIRYERGNFKGGYCLVMDQRMILINKFYPLESKINTLADIIREIEIDEAALSPEQINWVNKLKTEPQD